jgi:hypothetical protein
MSAAEYQALLQKPQKSKYGSKRVEYEGKKFDSQAEANYYAQLKYLWLAGDILQIELQPEYVLQEAGVDNEGNKIRQIIYRADFRVLYRNGKREVIDVKGHRTKEYLLKIKMLRKKYPDINFREVNANEV